MRLNTLGQTEFHAKDYLALQKSAEARTKAVTDLVDQKQASGFPGFEAIFTKVWGILKLPSTPAEVEKPKTLVIASERPSPLVVGGLVLAGGLVLLSVFKKRK